MQDVTPLGEGAGRSRFLSLVQRLLFWRRSEPSAPPATGDVRERSVRVTYADDGERTVSWEIDTDSEVTATVKHKFPDALRHHYEPTETDQDLVLFAGSFGVDGDADLLKGEVRWRWGRPRPRIEAFGQRHTRDSDIADLLSGSSGGGMWVSHSVLDIDLPDGALPSPLPEVAERSEVAFPPGTASVKVAVEQEIGPTVQLDRATFVVPNGWYGMDGGGICDAQSRDVWWRGRSTCTGDGWVVVLDRTPSMSGDLSFRALKDQQGFRFTHVGEIRRADGALFGSDEVFGVLERVRIGLDLALGRRVTCALPVGYVADKPVWARWFTSLLHPYRKVSHVLDDTVADAQVASIVGLTLDATSDAVASTAIKAAVGYYTSANNDVPTDLSVSLPISGLQLMAYFHFVSSSSATYSKNQWKAAAPTTGDEIGLLLDDMKVVKAIPAHFKNLLAARASMSAAKQAGDAVSTIIAMRNVVIHPTKDLPAETYDPYMWSEASSVACYWLCLSVLKEIGYTGRVANIHQAKPRWTGDLVSPPWVPPPSP